MNLFTGMTDHEIVSSILGFALFNGYVVLLAISLAAFWATSRPRRGRVRVAALWHMLATVLLMVSFISTVWAAPVEKSFIDADQQPLEPFFQGVRFQKVLIGLGVAAVAVLLMIVGAVQAGRQKRAVAQQALHAEAPAEAVRS
jgi:branched-subunit amino acid ABC-type transport system permease component